MSWPIQIAIVCFVMPRNQATEYSFVVPVLPAMFSPSFAADAAVPRCTTPRIIPRRTYAFAGEVASFGSGVHCSRVTPSAFRIFSMNAGL